MDQKLTDALTQLVNEITAQKIKENEITKTNPPNNFWEWLKNNTGSISALISVLAVVIGGVWTFYQFSVQQRQILEQQKRDEKLRRQQLIISSIDDLNDSSKRNTAAYALAILADEQAFPLLLAQFEQTVENENEQNFQKALTRSLILIGEPALPQILEINRSAALNNYQDKGVLATQSIIKHFMTDANKTLSKYNLGGVVIRQNFSYHNLKGVEIPGAFLVGSSFCRADLSRSNLKNIYTYNSEFGSCKFTNANVSNVDFSQSSFSGSIFFDSTIAVNTNFKGLDLAYSSFQNADLEKSIFNKAFLLNANFKNAKLVDVDFVSSYLEGADFSGVDLKNVLFFPVEDSLYAKPSIHEMLLNKSKYPNWHGRGAFVKDANFKGAKNLPEANREYLCKWGAINVPGGCVGIKTDTIPDLSEEKSFLGSSACF